MKNKTTTNAFFYKAIPGKNGFFLYALGCLALIAAFTIGHIPYNKIALQVIMQDPEVDTMNEVSAGIGLNFNLFLIMIPFLIASPVLLLWIRYVHKRPILSVFTAYSNFRWKRFFSSFLIFSIFLFIPEIIDYFQDSSNYEFKYAGSRFWVLLLLSLLLSPIQTGFEEVFIRGYLMQAFGLMSRLPWLAYVISALIFCFMHSQNPEVDKYGPKMYLLYLSWGLIFGFFVLMDNGLEISMGAHFSNNFFMSIFLCFDECALQTYALFFRKFYDPTEDITLGILSLFALSIFYSYFYKWRIKDISSIFDKINIKKQHIG